MKHLLKHILVLLLLGLQSSSAKAASPIAEYRMDERTVYGNAKTKTWRNKLKLQFLGEQSSSSNQRGDKVA